MRIRALLAGSLLLVTPLLLSGCRGGSDSPGALFDFPEVTCSEADLEITAEASLLTDPQGGERPAFLVKVCVFCDGDPVRRLSGIQAVIDSPPPGTATIMLGPIGLTRTTDRGCSEIGFRDVAEELAGKTVRVDVPDSRGRVIQQVTTTVSDQR